MVSTKRPGQGPGWGQNHGRLIDFTCSPSFAAIFWKRPGCVGTGGWGCNWLMMSEIGEADGEFGPAMLALNERQRAFVVAVLDRPTARGEDLMRKAGYGGPAATSNSLKVSAHHMMHNPRVQAALEEETRRRVRFGGLLGVAGLIRMARNPKNPHHFRACEALADRAGYGVVAKHEVKVEHTDRTGTEMAARIRELAGVLGVDAERLLGGNAVAPVKVIEHE